MFEQQRFWIVSAVAFKEQYPRWTMLYALCDAQKKIYNTFMGYGDLLFTLLLTELKNRYHQTALGVLWVLLQPLLTSWIFMVFFYHRAHRASVDTHTPAAWALSGVLAWMFFSQGMNRLAQSCLGYSYLIKKVYFPKIFLPLSQLFVSWVDLMVGSMLLLLPYIFYTQGFHLHLFYLPLAMLWLAISTLSLGLSLAVLNVLFRDIKYLLPLMMQIFMLTSPVVCSYLDSMQALQDYGIPASFYALHPAAAAMEFFRYAALGGELSSVFLWQAGTLNALLLVASLWLFQKLEPWMADYV